MSCQYNNNNVCNTLEMEVWSNKSVSDDCLDFRAKQQNLEERQADVEYELRCLLNKPGMKKCKNNENFSFSCH